MFSRTKKSSETWTFPIFQLYCNLVSAYSLVLPETLKSMQNLNHFFWSASYLVVKLIKTDVKLVWVTSACRSQMAFSSWAKLKINKIQGSVMNS